MPKARCECGHVLSVSIDDAAKLSGLVVQCPGCQEMMQFPDDSPADGGQVVVVNNYIQNTPDTPREKTPRRPGFECRYCGTRELPEKRSRMGNTGLIVLIALLIVFFPLFWIGFLIREEYMECVDCGAKLS